MIIPKEIFYQIQPFHINYDSIEPHSEFVTNPPYYIFVWGKEGEVHCHPVVKITKSYSNAGFGIVSKYTLDKAKVETQSYTFYHQVDYGYYWILMDINVYNNLLGNIE